jgi:Membrane-fusion protein
MDIQLEKKKGIRKKHLPYIIVGAFVLVAILWLIFGNHASKYNVDRDKISIQDVTRAEFNDYVRVNGQVQPINTIFLSAQEGGMVDEKVVEEGATVHRGQVIVRLTNPMLSLDILNSEAQLAEKQNFLRETQVTMEQQKLSLRREQLTLEMELDRKERKYDQYKKLYDEQLISKEEYLQAKEDYDYGVRNLDLVMERQKQDSIYRGIQIDQMEESLRSIRQNLLLGRQRMDNLEIKAPVDGQLGLLDVEIGQSIGSGQRVGQINVLSDYKIEAQIDEHYIDRVRAGLTATFDRQDNTYNLVVRKVYPEVRDKQFKTDFVFEGDRPENIRTGQTYYINLQLGQPVEAILIPRGAFYQNTGGQWIYVLTGDGKKAVRRDITIGRQNPLFYEVLSGLEPGEKVVTSSYDAFKDVQELVIR